MAIHPSLVEMLKESLPEFIHSADYCVSFSKDAVWGEKQRGGCLGYPAAALLFSIADSIGSYHAADPKFTVPVDGKKVPIRHDPSQHLFIFNSTYYRLSLSRHDLRKIYENYRCLLIHNSALAFEHFLLKGAEDDPPFIKQHEIMHINVAGLLKVTKRAVDEFFKVIDVVVPGSLQESRILQKK